MVFLKMIEFFEKPADNLVKPAEFWVSNFFLFLTQPNFILIEFF
jgi:hypothetical protein